VSKADTAYSEKERMISANVANNFNLNPFALFEVAQDYAKHCYPAPVKLVWQTAGKDLMDGAAESKGLVELHISTAGYMGKNKGDINKLDPIHVKLLTMSYYQGLRPMPVSFQLFGAIEFHFRTPGESDFDPKNKNPMREIFNPTVSRAAPKKKRAT